MKTLTLPTRQDVDVITPALYEVAIAHARIAPVKHSFRYSGYQWLVDVDALPKLPRGMRSLARFEAGDHFGDPSLPLRSNVEHFLSLHDVDLNGGRIVMLSQARVLGYVFNPLSVFWCYSTDGELVCVIAEVHNTYGDRHAYLLDIDADGRASTDKAFYVSPFNPVDGTYEMRMPAPDSKLALTITLERPNSPAFVATMTGRRITASHASVTKMAFKHPVSPLLGALRIRRHGITLWLRGMRPVPRPEHRQEGVQ